MTCAPQAPITDLTARLHEIATVLARGDAPRAARDLDALMATHGQHPLVVAFAGRAALLQGRPQDALPLLERAHALDPTAATGLWRAICLAQTGQIDAAHMSLARIEALPCPSAAEHLLRAVAWQAVGDTGRALGHATHHAEACPDDPQAHARVGRLLRELGRPLPAIVALTRAVAIAATRGAPSMDAYLDLGAALCDCGRFAEALTAARIALGLPAGDASPQALNNAGLALMGLNRSDEAVLEYDRALAISPDFATAAFGRALALLKSGRYAEGWAAYESRWQGALPQRTDLLMPRWHGEARRGRTLLVHCEQGFGDSLQFCRYLPELDPQDGEIIVEAPAVLHRLLRTLPATITLVDSASAPAAALAERAGMLHCPLMSLPHCLPRQHPFWPGAYLQAPAPQPGSTAGPGLTIGLVWAGDPRPGDRNAHAIDQRRSLPFAALGPLFAIDGVRFVSCQLGPASADCPPWLPCALEGVSDFADSAARLLHLDLIVTVDTSMAHLAGALGRPVWVMSRVDACWRWGDRGETSAWYPSLRLFRQQTPGDWAQVVSEVAAAVRRLAEAATLPQAETFASAA